MQKKVLSNRIVLTEHSHSLLTSADKRYQVNRIKHHEFFCGVNWDTIRQIQPPFVPKLCSVVDTSYFPTDEIEQSIPGDIAPPFPKVPGENAGPQRELAFLG